MDEESGFLTAIRSAPDDDTARLVYADWLDEQSDPFSTAKSAFLRLALDIRAGKWRELRLIAARNRLRKIAFALDPEWLAVVSHPALENCRLKFQFECPREWNKLVPTEHAHVRACDACNHLVFYCTTFDEATHRTRQGQCVAVSVALVRTMTTIPQVRVGKLSPEMIERLRAARTPDFADPLPDPAEFDPPPVESGWVPEQGPTRPLGVPRKKRRQSRSRQRNIERQDWEE